ncbi:MAG: transporter [bacterium]
MQRTRAIAWLTLILLVLLIPALPPGARAQDVEARLYANVPKGTNFIAVVYKYSRGEIMLNGTVIEDLKGNLHTPVIGYARAFSLGGMTAKFDVQVPYTWMDASAKVNLRDSSRTWNGLSDPRVRFTLNFAGSPALAPAEFVKWKQKTLVGASIQVLPPLGKYDTTRLINLGSNRWTFRGEVAVSHRVRDWIFEGYASLFFFTDNSDYYGGQTLSQEPVGIFQAHVIYHFEPRMWLGVDGLYARGGTTTLEGVGRHDFQDNTRIGATFALPLARAQNLKLTWSSGVSTRIGADFDNFALTYLYNW